MSMKNSEVVVVRNFMKKICVENIRIYPDNQNGICMEGWGIYGKKQSQKRRLAAGAVRLRLNKVLGLLNSCSGLLVVPVVVVVAAVPSGRSKIIFDLLIGLDMDDRDFELFIIHLS